MILDAITRNGFYKCIFVHRMSLETLLISHASPLSWRGLLSRQAVSPGTGLPRADILRPKMDFPRKYRYLPGTITGSIFVKYAAATCSPLGP